MIRRLIVLAFLLRLPFLFDPVLQTADEHLAVEAVTGDTSRRFLEASSWSERWTQVESLSGGGRILWIVDYLLWGTVVPGDHRSATLLGFLISIAVLVLLGAVAANLYGPRGRDLFLLLAVCSPFFLHYTFRVTGSMPAVLWLAAALGAFTRPVDRDRRRWSWGAGGFSLGLAFTTHYGSGPIILGIAAGLLGNLVRTRPGRGGDPRPGEGPRHGFPLLVLGALAALVPLIGLELWARAAGSSYLARLLSHENIASVKVSLYPGPHGLFARHLLDLDPVLVFMIVSLLRGLGRGPARRLVGPAVLVAVVLPLAYLAAIGHPPSGTWLVPLVFGVLAFVLPLRSGPDETPVTDRAGERRRSLEEEDLWLSVLVILALFLVWRPVSSMSRITFMAWPLIVLAMIGPLSRIHPGGPAGLAVRLVLPGLLALGLGLAALQHGRSFDREAACHAQRHPSLRGLHYLNFIRRSSGDGFRILRHHRPDRVEVFGPWSRVTPATFYDEEPFRVLPIAAKLKKFGLDRILRVEDVVYGWILFEERSGAAGS